MKKKRANKDKPVKSSVGMIPLWDRVLIKEEETAAEGKRESGIYIPETVKEDRGTKQGRVIAVGEGKYENGKLVPLKVKVSQTVLFQWGDKVTFRGEEYYIVRESEILAIIR
ncbi:co-chaperone GroES [Patescibacteria group bacterium]|nr:MAG: co-chaperone GroES [Patescibacteria group bacterium]